MSETCLDCHEGKNESLLGTSHYIVEDELNAADALIACTDCHLGDEGHWENDPERYAMTKPDSTRGLVTQFICASCHVNSHQQNMIEQNVHAANEVNCTACHKVHGSEHRALLQDDEAEMCMDCHKSVRGQFAKPFRHPVSDGVVSCSECHMTTWETQRALSFHGANAACVSCHNEFQGPFPFEHQATVDYATEEGGCISCHDPHGSYLPRLLKQPYEAPHFQLCTQCHMIPPKHNSNSFHGTTWSGVSCSECHTDIHGSYTSRLYLTPALQGQGCINVGCHQF